MILLETLTDKISETKNDYEMSDMKSCRRIMWVCLTILWDWRLKG